MTVMRAALAAAVLGLLPIAAFAVDDTQWPPPAPIVERMHALEAVIRSPDSTMPQREAAREELAGLLKSPAGRTVPPAPTKLPPRAAIDPYPSVVRPLPPRDVAVPPPPGVAHVEVLEPPKSLAVNPRSGSVAAPSGNVAIDPATGHVLQPLPGGYVDPRTGQFVPR